MFVALVEDTTLFEEVIVASDVVVTDGVFVALVEDTTLFEEVIVASDVVVTA